MINYEKSFNKLVEQIETELTWAKETLAEDKKNDITFTDAMRMSKSELFNQIAKQGKITYDRGTIFAYKSILELAEKLKNGEFEFDE